MIKKLNKLKKFETKKQANITLNHILNELGYNFVHNRIFDHIEIIEFHNKKYGIELTIDRKYPEKIKELRDFLNFWNYQYMFDKYSEYEYRITGQYFKVKK